MGSTVAAAAPSAVFINSGDLTMDEQLQEQSIHYMRVATIHRVYAVVVAQVAKGEWTHEDIGARLGKPAKWVAKTLSSPDGWTLNLVSDLCLAMDCEVAFGIAPFQRRIRPVSASEKQP